MEPVTISLRQLWTRIRAQPLPEKLFFWGAAVYTSSTVLPWVGTEAVHWNAWDLGLLVGLANLVVLAGLVVQVGGLAGIGPGGTSPRWLASRGRLDDNTGPRRRSDARAPFRSAAAGAAGRNG